MTDAETNGKQREWSDGRSVETDDDAPLAPRINVVADILAEVIVRRIREGRTTR